VTIVLQAAAEQNAAKQEAAFRDLAAKTERTEAVGRAKADVSCRFALKQRVCRVLHD